jgi:hypothetical protein
MNKIFLALSADQLLKRFNREITMAEIINDPESKKSPDILSSKKSK